MLARVYYLPEFDGSLLHWLIASYIVLGPLLFVAESTGKLSFGYSKFAKGDKRSMPSLLGWLFVYAPSIVLVWIPLLVRDVDLSVWHIVIASMVSAHFTKRCLEVLTIHRYSGAINLDAAVLICGLYSCVSYMFGEVAAVEVGPGEMPIPDVGVLTITGAVIWVFGVSLNLYSHVLLARLREPGETSYKPPRGGLFSLVACPHYLGELIGWWGFSLIFHHAWAPICAFAMTCYLAGRSNNTVRWYRELFGERIPDDWRRLLPFVY